ncbi:MAG: hypothetical protein ACHQRM_16520 [Bacteroidia bacterium]
MLVLTVNIGIVLIPAAYLFFAPFYLEINTVSGLYSVRFHRLCTASIRIEDQSFVAEIKLPGWRKQIDLMEIGTKKPTTKRAPKKTIAVKKKQPMSFSRKKIWGVLRSFKINTCEIVLDTGDMQLNGILYPLFFMLGCYSNKEIRINFLNENRIILQVRNSLARMSWAYISS